MRRLKLWLLGLTIGCNLLFWPLISNHYRLRGFLLGYPNTAVMGSVALVLLAYLSVSVRQTRSPRLARSRDWRSPWHVGRFFVLLTLGVSFLAFLLVCLALLVRIVLQVLLPFVLFPLGFLLWGLWGACLPAMLLAYVGSVLLFQNVARLLHKVALPTPTARVATTLTAVSVVFAFTWAGAHALRLAEGYAPSCPQRFVSPSGQRTLVLERRVDWFGLDPGSYAYLESGWWRLELQDALPAYAMYNSCTDTSLRVQWSADEKQVDLQSARGHGQWQLQPSPTSLLKAMASDN